MSDVLVALFRSLWLVAVQLLASEQLSLNRSWLADADRGVNVAFVDLT